MSSPSVLDQLCTPLSRERFLAQHWPDQAYWRDGPLDALPTALQTPELRSIAALLSRYRGSVSFGNAKTGGTTIATQASPATLLQMGLSLYLTDLEANLPALTPMLRQLEAELDLPAQCTITGAFVAAEGNGVTVHFDPSEVISIQLCGEKRIDIAKATDIEQPWGRQFNPGMATIDDMYPQVGTGFPDPQRATFESVHMKPGSVLFMPRGTWHKSEAGSESMSVSIFLRPPTALDIVLEALRLRLLQEPDWRRPLHGLNGSSELNNAAAAQWNQLKATLPDICRSLDIDDLRLAKMPEAERLAQMNADSRLQRKSEAELVTELSAQGNTVACVRLLDQYGVQRTSMEMDIPPAMVEIFKWLADQRGAFCVRELADTFPQFPLDQHLRIVNALVRSAYLKLLWFRATAD